MFWKKKKKVGGLPDLQAPIGKAPSISDYRNPPQPNFPQKYPQIKPSSPPSQTFPTPQAPKHTIEKVKSLEELPHPDTILPVLPAFKDDKSLFPPSKNPPYKVIEMEEWNPNHVSPEPNPLPESLPEYHDKHPTGHEATIPEPPEMHQFEHHNQRADLDKPIFVKIDKFKTARNSLESIKEKLTEIDELLKMIREVKLKEDRELSSWEKEMENIKARISHVTSEIFDNSYT